MEKILKEVFGYKNFRPLQKEIIKNILEKKDSLIIMPTGGGKSLCYQVPALLFDGLTIVVSPLISLMQDQVYQLKEIGINAAVLNSSISRDEYFANVNNILSNSIKLLYLAPETLVQERTVNLLSKVKVDFITVDEAHCISEWGHEFRPEYRKITEFRKKFPDAVCAAFTATATPRVQKDIMECLNFNNDNLFIASFNRKNLFLEIVPKISPEEQTVSLIENFIDQQGIIYCQSRKQVDALADFLTDRGYLAKPYHAGLSSEERLNNQNLFVKDDINIIVATIAFGMGINKPNIRYVIHYDLPKNIESYYQQIGRAGRDGLYAHCRLLFSYGDIRKIKYFIEQMKNENEKRIANIHLNSIVALSETNECRRTPLINYFGEVYSDPKCDMCDNCNSDDKSKIDLTIPAQKFMSCIARTGEIFGANHIISVLRGSKLKKILDLKHDQLSTYGIGMEYSAKQWMFIARQLQSMGYVKIDETYGSLKLTGTTRKVFRGELKVLGSVIEDKQKDIKKNDIAPDCNYELVKLLKLARKNIAVEKNIPPYAVFSDKTLFEMAEYFPHSKSSLLTMHGIGTVKADKYGDEFINIINKFCEENGLIEKRKNDSLKISERKTKKPKSTDIGEAFKSTGSIKSLAEYYKIEPDVVIENLYRYVVNGNTIPDCSKLLDDLDIDEELIKLSLDLFEEYGTEYLKKVYDELECEITYNDLKLIRLFFIAS
ncbi:MAG: DNA helicase RecQ [bacterium]|nr:DNA helicase RecQ [bacterium]